MYISGLSFHTAIQIIRMSIVFGYTAFGSKKDWTSWSG